MEAHTTIGPQELIQVKAVHMDKNPAAVYLASLGPGSKRTMQQSLDVIAGLLTEGRIDALTLNWPALHYQHTQTIRTALAGRYRPATANKMLCALKGVFKEAWRLGLMDAETYHRAVDLKRIKTQILPAGRALSSGEIRSLFEACEKEDSPASVRDASLVAVLYGTGMRRSEVVGLDFIDFNPDTGEIVVRGGKGRKDRLVYAPDGTIEALKDWIKVRGNQLGPLLCPLRKGGWIELRRMTDQAVFNRLRFLATKAGVKDFSPHDLRRTFITDLLDLTGDLATVQKLTGHANSATTARYDQRGERAKKNIAGKLNVPYRTGR